MEIRTVILVCGSVLIAWGALRIARGRREWSRDRLVQEGIGVALVGSIVAGAVLEAGWVHALTLLLAVLSMVHRDRARRG